MLHLKAIAASARQHFYDFPSRSTQSAARAGLARVVCHRQMLKKLDALPHALQNKKAVAYGSLIMVGIEALAWL